VNPSAVAAVNRAMTTSLQRHRLGALALLIGLALLATFAVRESRASGQATASGAKTVSIVNFAFKPGTTKIKRGGRVTFTNTTASTTHTATDGGVFDTKRIKPGESETVKFEHRGTFAFHCKIHPFMKGKIVVE